VSSRIIFLSDGSWPVGGALAADPKRDLFAGRVNFLHEVVSREHANRSLPIRDSGCRSLRLKKVGDRAF
jgi:hypothetical protein